MLHIPLLLSLPPFVLCLPVPQFSSILSSQMGHSFMFKEFSPELINIIIIILTTLIQKTRSADPLYEACEPRNCGQSPNISYPFYIPNVQESYCGYPGFEISCKDEEPFLKMSGGNYLVRDIFYTNRSLLVANAKAVDTECPVLNNITLERTPFKFGPAHVDLFLFYDCASVPSNYQTYLATCASNNISHHSFAMFLHDGGLKYLNSSSLACKSSVSAPVDMEGGMNFATTEKRSYSQFLKEGFQLEWTVSICNNCETSGGRPGFYKKELVCFCRDGPRSLRCSGGGFRSKLSTKIAIAVPISGFFIIAVITLLLVYSRKRYSTEAQKVEALLRNHGSLAPKRYKYSDIRKMTNSFKDKLGQGSYGDVFKGKLLDGSMVAVKLLRESKGNGEEFINEVASISRTSHVNVVRLLGFCFDEPKRALIYEFMPNGSLEKFIYGEKPLQAHPHLGWERLYEIAVGIARGLEYLHRGCNTRILHFDIKPHNILLDQDFCPKISDFGLAKQCPKKESIISMIDARGTVGYIAPEVFSKNFGGVSHKSDVYSYGMMILEMVGGRKNNDEGVDHVSEIYFPHWIYKRLELDEDFGLHGVMTEKEEEIARKMVLGGLWCIQTDPSKRPSMNGVVDMLEGSLESLQIPPKPFVSFPPRSSICSLTVSMS